MVEDGGLQSTRRRLACRASYSYRREIFGIRWYVKRLLMPSISMVEPGPFSASILNETSEFRAGLQRAAETNLKSWRAIGGRCQSGCLPSPEPPLPTLRLAAGWQAFRCYGKPVGK